MVRCAIWYHLFNLKNVKNTHGGALILVATLLKLTLLREYFLRSLNCTNGTKFHNASLFLRKDRVVTFKLVLKNSKQKVENFVATHVYTIYQKKFDRTNFFSTIKSFCSDRKLASSALFLSFRGIFSTSLLTTV